MITLLQSAIGGTGAATFGKAFPSNNAAGNFLFACVRFYNTGLATYTLGDSNTNTWTKVGSGFLDVGSNIDLWFAPNCNSGPNTVTVTCSNPNNPNPEMAIAEASGLLTSSVFDVSASAQSGSNSNAPNSGNITTSQAVELLVGFCTNETAGGQTNTPAAGWTPLISDGDMFVCYRVTSAAGTYSYSSTLSSSVAWGAYIAAFKGAAAPPPSGGKPVVCIMQ